MKTFFDFFSCLLEYFSRFFTVEIGNVSQNSDVILMLLNLVFGVFSFGFSGPLRQYFSLYRAVSQREGESEEKG